MHGISAVASEDRQCARDEQDADGSKKRQVGAQPGCQQHGKHGQHRGNRYPSIEVNPPENYWFHLVKQIISIK